MADGFDSEEILYNMISGCGVSVFKGPAPRDQSGDHVVVRAITSTSIPQTVNVVPTAVNIFVPKAPNGMINRSRIKALRTIIMNLIKNASDPAGYYCKIDQSFSTILEDAKEGFDCFTIRYELTLNT